MTTRRWWKSSTAGGLRTRCLPISCRGCSIRVCLFRDHGGAYSGQGERPSAPTPRHKHGTPNFAPLLLPLTESGLCKYFAWLATQNISFRTIKSFLSALRCLQIHRRGCDPQMSGMVVLQYVVQGVRRSQALTGTNTPRARLPNTTDIMRRLRRSWEARGVDFNTVMWWAVACTCFSASRGRGRQLCRRRRRTIREIEDVLLGQLRLRFWFT